MRPGTWLDPAMKEADNESVQLCVHRFAAFLRARDELDRTLALDLIEAVRRDDGEARDRALALAAVCTRAIREKSGWRVDEGEVFPTFERMLCELTAHMRQALEDHAARRAEEKPPHGERLDA